LPIQMVDGYPTIGYNNDTDKLKIEASGLETKVDSTNTKLDTANTKIETSNTNLSSISTKLDTLSVLNTLNTLLTSIKDTNGIKKITDNVNINVKTLNQELLSETTVIWDGVKLTDNIEVPLTNNSILITINNNQAQLLVVTFENEIITDTWSKWYDGTGTEVKFTCPANSYITFGAFQCFPKFLGGRIVLTASSIPANLSQTSVQIQEV